MDDVLEQLAKQGECVQQHDRCGAATHAYGRAEAVGEEAIQPGRAERSLELEAETLAEEPLPVIAWGNATAESSQVNTKQSGIGLPGADRRYHVAAGTRRVPGPSPREPRASRNRGHAGPFHRALSALARLRAEQRLHRGRTEALGVLRLEHRAVASDRRRPVGGDVPEGTFFLFVAALLAFAVRRLRRDPWSHEVGCWP